MLNIVQFQISYEKQKQKKKQNLNGEFVQNIKNVSSGNYKNEL